MLHVPSSDGVTVAVHELAGPSDDNHPVVLVAHATGFHGHAYLPVAAALAPRFHTFALDFRGHGDTGISPSWTVEWAGYGDDALAAAEAVAAVPGASRGLIGFGHSMGGTALLGAAHRRPELFALLVVFEPIVPPFDPATATTESDRVNMLVTATRRRRALFPSIEAARANYAAKPPLDAFDPEALDAYVRFGFHPDVDGAGVRLKCDPELEARTFEAGTWQRTWAILPEVTVPVVVVSGQVADDQPSRFSADVAGLLPKGHFLELGDLDHFGPMTHPRLIADLVAQRANDAFGDGSGGASTIR